MADNPYIVYKKIPTYQEYVERRQAGESHEEIRNQTIQEREAYHQSLPYNYYDVPAYTELTKGLPGERITGNTVESRLQRESWVRAWQDKVREDAANVAARRENAGQTLLEGVKDLDWEKIKQANADAKYTVNWAGRDKLIEEYKQLQEKITTMERRLERGGPGDPAQLKRDKARLEEIQKELDEKDNQYGNGSRDYTFVDKAGSYVGGIAKGVLGGVASAVTTTKGLIDQSLARKRVFNDFLQEAETNPNAVLDPARLNEADKATAEKYANATAFSDMLLDSASEDTQRLKNGMGLVGRAAVDITQNAIEMGIDAGVAYLTGGSALAPMFVRSAGQSAYEARKDGATIEQQVGYGLTKGAIEVATEKLFDGVARIYGAGAADEVVEHVIGRLAKSDAGRSLLRMFASGVGEGSEEVLSDLLSPLAEKIYKDQSLGELYDEIKFEDVLYDYLIGAALGTLGGAGSFIPGKNGAPSLNAAKNAELRAIDEQRAQTRAAREAGYGSIENQVSAAWDVLSGRVTPEQQQTRTDAAQKTLGLTDEQRSSAEGYQNAPKEIRNQKEAGELLTMVFNGSGIALTEQEHKTLTALAAEGKQEPTRTVMSMRAAYDMGEQGAQLPQVQEALKDSGLTPNQIKGAWMYGRSVQTARTGPADVNTEEGRTKLTAALKPLGTHAAEAFELYKKGQDVGRYAAAMQKAAFLYAANNGDVAKIAEDAREGRIADSLGYLSDDQLKLAQKIGAEQRQQKQEAVKKLGAERAALREQAAEITKGRTVTAEAIAQTETALEEARAASTEAKKVYSGIVSQMEAMQKADPKEWQSESFQAAYDALVEQQDAAMQQVKALDNQIRELEKKTAEIKGRKVIQRKKGTVSYAGGTMDGKSYEGVDPSKLTRQQKKVAAMVEALADAVNLDYVIFSGEANVGGMYKNGRIWVNINSGMGVGEFNQTIAAASLSHELTHFLQEYAPEEYQQLKDFVVQEILKASPEELSRLVAERQRWNTQRTLSYDEALDEVVADGCQTMLLNSKAIRKLARENMTLAEKIADFIEDFTNKIRDAFAEVDPSQGQIFDAVRALEGSLEHMQELWDEGIEAALQSYNAEQTVESSLNADSIAEAIDAAEQAGLQYSRFVEDEDTLAFLNQQEKEGKVVHTYKSFLEIDGKLYPPMASMTKDENGKWKMAHAMETGRWEESVGDPSKIIVDPKTGKGYFKLKKDNGKDIKAAYNPYQHSSNLMLNDQFSSAYQRPNIVTYECIIPESELTSGYRAEYAKDTVGLHPWKSGVVATQIAKAKGLNRQVYLSRWLKPIRKVPEAEVAQHYKELIDGTDIAVPSNVVTPALLEALEDAGVKIEYTEEAPKKAAQNGDVQYQAWGDAEGVPNRRLKPITGEIRDSLQNSENNIIVDSHKKVVSIVNDVFDNPGKNATAYFGILTPDVLAEMQQKATNVKKEIRDRLFKEGKGYFLAASYSSIRHLNEDGKLSREEIVELLDRMADIIIDNDTIKYSEYTRKVPSEPGLLFEKTFTDGVYGAYDLISGKRQRLGMHTMYIEGRDSKIKKEALHTPAGVRASSFTSETEGAQASSDSSIADTEPESKTQNQTQFQMISDVEETPRLVAVHNKSVSGLQRMMERGGVPFPSIAIKKAGTSHEGFGDVSIVFPKSTIDPEVNRQNRLYSNDAWTPTEPRTEYEVDIPWKLKEKIRNTIGDNIFQALNGYSYLDDGEVAKALADNSGDLFKALRGKNVIKYAYLKSIGKEPAITQRESALDGSHKYKNAQLLYLFSHVSQEEIANASYNDTETLGKIADALNEQFLSQFEDEEKREKFRRMKVYTADKISLGYIQSALAKYQGNGNAAGMELDTDALSRELMNNTEVENDPGYKEWLEKTFGKTIKGSGIPNGKDPYTSSGNRRSFKQTHVPATLENIVAQMQKEQEKGIGIFGVNLRGAATKTYKTIEDMRAESGKLLGERISDDVYDSYMKGFYDRLHQITGQAANSQSYSSLDSTEQILLETLRDATSKAQMGRMLAKEARWIKVYPELTEELWQLKQDVQNMPAPYFEAKPRRIVYPEEALAYILPDTAPTDLIQKLEDKGYNVMTYKAGDEQDRLQKLNSVEGAQFQRWDNTDGDTAAEANGREQSYARIAAENAVVADTIAALKKLTDKQAGTIAKLQKRLQLTKTPEVQEGDARKLARSILKEYGSRAEVDGISDRLKALGDYILQTKASELNQEEVKNRAREIASTIIDSANEQIRTEDDTLTAIRGSIKGKKLTFDPAFMGELDQAGGFDAVRKRSFGTFTVARADSTNIDRSEYTSVSQFYADLQSTYGKGFFPDLANEGEELLAIAENARAAVPMEVNPYEQYMGEAVEHLANQISMDVLNGMLRPTPPTDADRAKTRRDELNRHIKELVAENKMQKKEAAELWATISTLSQALDKAEAQYETLKADSEARTMQVFAEGKARETEIQARERARAAEKIQALKEHYKEVEQNAQERRKESAGISKYREQVFRKAGKLREMLLKNDDKLHVPEVLKAPLAAFLESLDFTSTRALRGGAETNADRAFAANLQKIQQILSNQQDYINGGDMKENLGGYIDVSPDSMDFLRRVSEMITTALSENRDYTINQMSAAELKDLSNFLSNLRTAINGMNQFMANARFESVREAASADIQTIQELGRVSTAENGKLFHAAAWENGTPYYIFRRFGEGGKAIFDSFTRGWEKMALNVKEIMDFTEKAYTDKEVRDWQKETHAITLEDGSEITMTTAQIMELSMLLNREQAVKHLSKGGMRIADIEGKKGITTDTRHHHLTDADIEDIVGLLTPRQAQVAKAMQTFMAVKGAEWGNEISMRRFGYRFYTEGENYYPIKTDSNDRPMSDTDAQQNSMFRLLNLSASKSLNPKASNALIVGDIFDTFANHTSDMAKLNGMGLPILDAIKWFNFKERIDLEDGGYNTRTMQGAMEEAFGKQALSYFRTLMKDINGVTESGDRGTGFWSKLLSNYKAAAVGANLRVAFLQPTSYVRASYLIKPRYLLQAFTNKNAYKEAMENSGTAVWKSLGYYDTNIARGMRDQIKHNDGWRDKIVEKSMALAEFGDKRTWGRLWAACKMQAAAETGKTGNELIQATADLFREVIYSSQVMDSTLTRSELMRGKSQYTKALTAFMAEPTLSYNMVMDAAMEYNMNARRYGKGEAWKRSRGYITKAVSVYVCSAAFSAVVESIADAFRDDDDEEDFFLKWSQAMFGEGNLLSGNLAQDLSLFGKLPYIKNLMSALQGYKNKDMSTAALDSILDTYKIWKETIDLATGELDKPTKTTYYGKMTTWGKIYKTLQGISQLSGIAVANMTRDVSALWNTTVGAMHPEYKVKTYDGNTLSAAKVADWETYVKDSGISKSQFKSILASADVDGTVSPKQDELGAYLVEALSKGEITEEQAQAVWKSQWHSAGSKTFDKWRSSQDDAEESKAQEPKTQEATAPAPKPTPQASLSGFESFKKSVSLYSDKKASAYQGWENEVKPLGVSLDSYMSIINAADAAGDGNGSVKQDEMGAQLVRKINSGELSYEQAEAIWHTIWSGSRSKTFYKWYNG